MDSKATLAAIVAVLDPALRLHGFRFAPQNVGHASRGSFANGFFIRGDVRIGIIVREQLGEVVYEANSHTMGHSEYMAELGHAHDCWFLYDDQKWRAHGRDGREPPTALLHDLETFAAEFLRGDTSRFLEVLRTAHSKRILRWQGRA
jgi:hypothetical protein